MNPNKKVTENWQHKKSGRIKNSNDGAIKRELVGDSFPGIDPMDANDTSNGDEAGSIVKQRFYDFITESQCAEESENTTHQQRLMVDYKAQISSMIQNDKTTLFVSYQQLSDFDYELMEGLTYSFSPFSLCVSFFLLSALTPRAPGSIWSNPVFYKYPYHLFHHTVLFVDKMSFIHSYRDGIL